MQALKDIEDNWSNQIRTDVMDDFNSNPVIQELHKFEERLRENKYTGKLSWAELGKFGQVLYKKFSGKMSTAHWALYKSMKKKYAPEVRIGKVDINRANMNELRELFKPRFKAQRDALFEAELSDEAFETKMNQLTKQIDQLASQVYYNTPFMTLEDLATRGIITIDDIGYTEKNVVLISLVKKAYRESINFKSISSLGRVAQQIINYQRKNPNLCTEQEWYTVWQAYRIVKSAAQQQLGIQASV